MKADRLLLAHRPDYPLHLTLGLILQLREEEAITWKSTRTRYGDFQKQ